MGVTGIVILLFFVFMALLAPLLTPHDPIHTMQLASFRAKPEWLDSALPRNTYPILDPGFSSQDSLKDFTINSSNQITVTWSDIEGFPGIPLVEEGSGPGALLVTSYSPQNNGTTFIEKKFDYSYEPPRRFSVHVAYKVAVEDDAKWSIQILIKQTSGTVLMLWDSGVRSSSVNWAIPKPAIDTNNVLLRFRLFNDILGDASHVFPVQGSYSLIVKVTTLTENSDMRIYIDDLNPRIWGEAYGFLGTDNYGRDIFTQLVHGSRISLIIGIFSAFIAVFFGLIVGLSAGYIGGWIDEFLMRTNDVLLTIPSFPLTIVLTAIIGPSIWSVIILIGFLGWMGIARLIRSQVLSIKTKAFIEASRASGGGIWHIIRKHLIPNVMTMAYTQLALTVPGAIVAEAALSFIGLGDPFLQTWGKMLHDVQYFGAISEWWWAVPPGLCIALLSLAFVFIGYALDEIFNPKLRGR